MSSNRSGQQSYDAVVVGGGVIGLACAWRLAQRGARVALVERSPGLDGATRLAAGMLAPVGELAFGEPELLKLTLAAATLYPEFVAEVEAASGTSTGYSACGALHVALDRDEAAELRRVHELQRSLGLGAEWLPPRRCRELEPSLTPSFNGGVHAPGEAAVDPRALADALVLATRAKGARISYREEVVEGLFDGERLAGVRTAQGDELRATSVILATGAWSGKTPWLSDHARPPVRPVKGQIVELRARDGVAPCTRIVASERVYLVPRVDGRLVVGATVEEQGFDTAPTAGGVHELLREAYRLLPEIAEMELVEVAAGLRPGTPDNLPRVEPAPLDGLIWATGHYRNGILLAPLAANAVADLVATPDPVSSSLSADSAGKGELTTGGALS